MIIKTLLAMLPWMDERKAQIVIDAVNPFLYGLGAFTIPLSVASFAIGLMIALLVALVRINPAKSWWVLLLGGISRFYVSIIRGTPLLVQLFIIFYGLPQVNVILNPMTSAVIALSLNAGAYTAETLRAVILSVPKGQWEAGYSIGLTYRQNVQLVILPQAIRVAIPPLLNSFIGLIKESSLTSVVLVPEIMRQANVVASTSYEFLLVYTEAALFYWVVCLVLGFGQQKLEKRFSRYQSN